MTRLSYVLTTCLATLSTGTFPLFHLAPRLLWNASASAPVGLYVLHPVGRLRAGELVADMPPAPLTGYMAERSYLPRGVPLLKYITALAGQTVCRHDTTIFINGLAVATARIRDHLGRALPVWQGCHTLKPTEIFLLNPTVPDSFDGRYFGVLPRATVTARATPLWTEGTP